MTDCRRERQSYVRRAGGDEGGQGCVKRVKRDVKKAGEEYNWKKKTRDRGWWKRLSDEAVKKLRASPHPWEREKEEEKDMIH